MNFVYDAALAAERERFRLKLCCEDCAFFDPRGEGACVHGYPSERHREGALVEGEPMYFCKEFSLA